MKRRIVQLASLKQKEGEFFGKYCDRLESTVLKIVDEGVVSPHRMRLLAYILSVIPADFDYGSPKAPGRRLREFVRKQSSCMKDHFKEAMLRQRCPRLDRLMYCLK